MARSLNGNNSGVNYPHPRQTNTHVPENPMHRDSRDSHMHKQPRKAKAPKGLVIGVVAAAVAVGGFFGYAYLSDGTPLFGVSNAAVEDTNLIHDDGRIYPGVKLAGVDLSGMTKDEAAQAVNSAVQSEIANLSINYTIDGETYTLTGADVGAQILIEKELEEAINYGRTGTFEERMTAITTAAEQGYEIPTEIMFDEAAVKTAVEANGNLKIQEAQNASVEMNKISDESKKITDMEMSYVAEQAGREVNEDALIADILTSLESGEYNEVTAEIIEVQPEITLENIEGLYTERGIFKTNYSSSAEGRRYNIWKMSDIINGVKIEPGETWSINDEAGPRTYELGWKGAPGINEGVYKEEAGGGICQVSSTLYNAVLRAEVEVVDRSHHSWPLDYVDGGLDATISTGAPDFVIKNNYDVPIYIIARCDGEDSRTVEVAIYGPPYEDGLTRDFSSELIETFGGEPAITIADSSLPAGQTSTIIQEHKGKKYNVYKHLIDADGNEVSKELYYVDTYAYKPAQIRVGTGAAAPDPAAQAAAEAQAAADAAAAQAAADAAAAAQPPAEAPPA